MKRGKRTEEEYILEQRRYELAKAAMQGLLSNVVQGYMRDKPTLDIVDGIIENSIDIADKMLEKLNTKPWVEE